MYKSIYILYPPTCFGHSCGNLQGGALHGVHPIFHKILQYFDIFIPCNAPPGGWPLDWPKHVGIIPCLFAYTYAHFILFRYYI